MAILVTGGSGYIGSHVVSQFVDEGYQVVVVDNATTSIPQHIDGADYFPFSFGDEPVLDYLLSQYDIETVIHLGGLIDVRESMDRPDLYYGVNVYQGRNLIHMMKKHGVRKMIFASSAAVYGEPEYTPMDEDHQLNPVNVYGDTKRVFENVLKENDMDYINLRYFNVAGSNGILRERHYKETHVIPLLIDAIMNDEPFTVYGDGWQERDFVHVEDLAQAHLLAYKRLQKGYAKEVYNIGSGEGVSVNQLIKTAADLFNKDKAVRRVDKNKSDPLSLIADNRKAKKDLGFEVTYGVEDMLLSHWEALETDVRV